MSRPAWQTGIGSVLSLLVVLESVKAGDPSALLPQATRQTGHSQQTTPPPLNVVFILADDLGWADTSLYGHTRFHQTPNLDRLAQQGLLLTRAYSASPLCSPTRSAILTGLSPARTGITTPNCHLPEVVLTAAPGTTAAPNQKCVQPKPVTRLRTDYRTLAESLKEAGYATGHFGKWHLGREPYSPLQHGFDVDLPHHPGPGPAGSYVAPWKFETFDPDPDVPDQHIEDRMAQEASTWIEANRERPFFLNYWMFSVHAPFDAKKDLIEKYAARVDADDEQKCPTYAAMIESMDDAVGTLLDTLDRLKLTDQTVIIFTSDNGGNMYNNVGGVVPTSNRPLKGGKATMYEGGTRVPCVIAWPGITTAGSRTETLIQSEDFYPTLLDGLEIAPAANQQFDGISVLPALRGEPMKRNGVVQYFPHSPGVPNWLPPAVSFHEESWKLIRLFHGGDDGAHRYLLFDLSNDLSEAHNLADRHPDVVDRLDQQIEWFLQNTNAIVPAPNKAFDPSQYDPEQEGRQKQQTKGGPEKGKSQAKMPENAKETAANADDDPALLGWKLRGCRATVNEGILQVTQRSANSFLGFATGKHRGPATVSFRIRSQSGDSHVDWLPGGPQSKASPVKYVLQGTDWQDVSVELPATGPIGIVRLYLPPGAEPVEIDWIELKSAASLKSRSDF